MHLRRFLIPATSLLLSAVAVAQTITMPTTTPATVPTTGPATQPTLTWDQAAQHIGETATVTGPVLGTHTLPDGHVLLNVGKKYPDPTRLTIFITEDASAPDPETTYVGKTVSVTGKIELFKKGTEIRASAADVVVAN